MSRFVRTTRRYRTVNVQAGEQIITTVDPAPDELQRALNTIDGEQGGAH